MTVLAFQPNAITNLALLINQSINQIMVNAMRPKRGGARAGRSAKYGGENAKITTATRDVVMRINKQFASKHIDVIRTLC